MVIPRKLLITSIAAAVAGVSPASYAQDDGVLEEVIVRGIASSLEQSLDIKRDSDQIVEAITADDIGKMPDQNIAESLQRLPGIQIDRRDGQGTQVRIRGLGQNITLLNGENFTSGMEYFQLGESRQEFDSSLEGIPSELLGGVEVYKSPKASLIEGALGGTINLKTRSSLDLDDLLFAANLKIDQGADSSEVEPNFFVVAGNSWGDFGALFSLSHSTQIVQTDQIQNFSRGAHRHGASGAVLADGTPYHAPSMFYATDTESERERLGASVNLQWRVSDATELSFDWFHSELDITNAQYVMKHAWFDNNFWGVDESITPEYDTVVGRNGSEYNIMQAALVTYNEGENNAAGEVLESATDNFAIGYSFDNGGAARVNAKVTMSQSDVEQRAGYADSRFSPYRQTTWVGYEALDDPDTPETVTGWGPVNNNTVAGDEPEPIGNNGMRTFGYLAGDQPQFLWLTPGVFVEQGYFTYKSHWALGSDVDQDTLTASVDLEVDIDLGDLKMLSWGVRIADDEVDFGEVRYMTDFSKTTGVATPTRFNADGTVAAATTYDPSATNLSYAVGDIAIQEAVYYDLCNNGGLTANDPGVICDINGDGYDDNQPFGPLGYFMDAGIGSKMFDLNERLYVVDVDGNPLDPADIAAWLLEADHNGDNVPGGYGEDNINSGTDPSRGDYWERSLSVALYGLTTDINWERWRNSPGIIEFETFTQNPDRYELIDDFFPSGGYSTSSILFQKAGDIAANVEGWIDGITPSAPGDWLPAPLESWKVKESTTALYTMADFEGDTYTLNLGVRVVKTDVEITKAGITTGGTAGSDDWNSQGVLLDGTWEWQTVTNDYWDWLPSANYVLNISDDSKLRATGARVIARPTLQNLGKGFNRQFTRTDTVDGTYYRFLGGSDGNPNLDPFRAWQFDVAYEYYFGDLGYASAGIFYKNIESFVATATTAESGDDGSPAGSSIGNVNRPFNGPGGMVQGFELAFQQSWDSGFGFSANYTFSDTEADDFFSDSHADLGIPGVSENTFNVMGFFENDILSARLSYTWRDEYLSPFRATFGVTGVPASPGNPPLTGIDNGWSEFFNDFGQFDASVVWNVMDNLSVSFEALNIAGEEQTSYLGWSNNTNTYQSQEARYIVGVMFRL